MVLEALNITKGRRYEEDYEVRIDDPFLEDAARIKDCAAHRRLAYKTQVISSPKDTFVRTRAGHTNEVVSESGIKTQQDVEKLKSVGVSAVLIGKTLCESPDIAEKFTELFG